MNKDIKLLIKQNKIKSVNETKINKLKLTCNRKVRQNKRIWRKEVELQLVATELLYIAFYVEFKGECQFRY